MNRQIGELRRAVAAHSLASKSVQTENNMFVVKVPAGVSSETTTVF